MCFGEDWIGHELGGKSSGKVNLETSTPDVSFPGHILDA